MKSKLGLFLCVFAVVALARNNVDGANADRKSNGGGIMNNHGGTMPGQIDQGATPANPRGRGISDMGRENRPRGGGSSKLGTGTGTGTWTNTYSGLNTGTATGTGTRSGTFTQTSTSGQTATATNMNR